RAWIGSAAERNSVPRLNQHWWARFGSTLLCCSGSVDCSRFSRQWLQLRRRALLICISPVPDVKTLPRPLPVKKIAAIFSSLALSWLLLVFVIARAADQSRRINLPTSKTLTLPVPGYLARTNSFPATIALSPNARYAALLNQGYGTQESSARQSIAILDLSNNELRDFPDDRLSDDYSTRQSYFIGLAFSSDGKHLYASMGSITDPIGEKPKSTGNGIP